MRQSTTLFVMCLMVAQVYTAPQLFYMKDGKVGVNFGGYHAAAGLGGLFGGPGGSGGLFAEAGTPFGQNARAGLGGSVDGNGKTAGGLYAGATAGGNVKAHAGLAGGVTGEHSAGTGFASAQAGDRFASAGMGGEASGEGASGFTFSGTKSFGVSGGKVKQVDIQPVQTVEIPEPVVHKNIETDIKVEAENEIKPIPAEAPVTVVKEVYVPPPTKVVEKTYVHTHYKPHRHHFRKYIGGYVGGEAGAPAALPAYDVQPILQKRIDVGAESAVGAEAHAEAPASGHIGYTKHVTVQRNPNFYADIFNIPISVLKSVSDLVTNAAGNTRVSVEKTASVHADGVSSKHNIAPLSSSSSSESETHVSVQTPSASNFFADIFAIPINTLGAVNKFLENNVGRKTVQVTQETHDGSSSAPIRVRRGPHARRRANQQVVILDSTDEAQSETHSE